MQQDNYLELTEKDARSVVATLRKVGIIRHARVPAGPNGVAYIFETERLLIGLTKVVEQGKKHYSLTMQGR